MPRPLAGHPLLLCVLALLLSTTTACRGQSGEADDDDSAPSAGTDPIHALYIGHSFGRPFAEALTDVAADGGIAGHTQDIVMRGGENGAPQALWDDAAVRDEILDTLAGGDIDLLVMICCSLSFLDDQTDPAIRLWMDEALAANPDTRIVLALPWPDYPERDYDDADSYAAVWNDGHDAWHALIDGLRDDYPGTSITCLPHGRAALELRFLHEDGALPDIDQLTGPSADSLFTDVKGHAGQILLDVGTLVWLGSLYDVGLADHPLAEGYETDIAVMADEIVGEDDHVR